MLACVLLAGAMSAPAAAQATSGTTTVHPTDIRTVKPGTTAGTINAEYTVVSDSTGADGRRNRPRQFHKVLVDLPWGTIGGLAKNTMKKGLWAYGVYTTAKMVIEGAGWAIDELKGQVTTAPAGGGEELGEAAYCINAPSGQPRCASAPGQLQAVAEALYLQDPYTAPCRPQAGPFGAIGYQCYVPAENAYGWVIFEYRVVRPGDTWPVEYVNDNPGSEPAQITDEQLGQLFANRPDVLRALLRHPATGAPHMTPELAQALNTMAQELASREGTAAGGTASPDPSAVGTDTPQATPMEFPDYCEWATVECDHIKWMEEEPKPEEPMELPIEEIRIQPSTWSLGLGSGTCPADKMMTFQLHGTHNIPLSFEGICTAAGYLRPIVIASGLIIAALIIGGLRQNKGA